jgi:hypothetical protein
LKFPKLKNNSKPKPAYNIYEVRNNKRVLIRSGLPINLGLKKAKDLLRSKKVTRTILVKSGKTRKIDFVAPALKQFQVIKRDSTIQVNKIMKKTISKTKKASKNGYKKPKGSKTKYNKSKRRSKK